MLIVGTVLGERYEIKEKIGAGGMSIVYKARCRKLQRYVAVKVLRSEFAEDEEFVASFRAEALSAASLSHPNIVGIYDVGHDQGEHYIVMEYVEGKTLKELIEAKAPYDNQTVMAYGVEILSAIRHAHMKGIIHRDIKPQNILVTNEGILKVTDFGIAKAVDSSTIVSTGTAIGSVHYFSPEQARGKYVDKTSDLYSCGIVLFELATGKLPFQADSHVTVALKHINEDIPRPAVLNKGIAPSLEAIILKATRKRADLRYQNAEEMLEDIRRLSLDSSYKISESEVDNNQETILMTPEETDFIRNNSNVKAELNIPSWANTNSGVLPTPPVVREAVEPENQEDDDEEEEATATYTAMVTIAGVLAAMVLIGIVTVTALPWFSKMNKPKVAIVPSVIGSDVASATSELEKLGLVLSVLREEEKEGVDAGKIIQQDPNRDDMVAFGSAVGVVVSKKLEVAEIDEAIVPGVLGMDFTDAQIELANADLRMKVERKFDDKIEAGIVISQYPMSGNTLAHREIVTLIVSKGPEIKTIPVPNVLNMDESTAIATLQRAGLSVGKISHSDNDDIAEGRIISQSIPNGREIDPSSSVSIVVSKGKKEELPPPPPAETMKSLTITVPSFLEEKEDYQVLIRLITENGESKTIYEGVVAWDQFPIPVSVKGKGKGTVETYIDNDRVYADPIDFDEVIE